jgi:hypothetical protein
LAGLGLLLSLLAGLAAALLSLLFEVERQRSEDEGREGRCAKQAGSNHHSLSF